MNSPPIGRIDLRQVGRALVLAAVVASVTTAIAVETETLDQARAVATSPVVHAATADTH